jgi:hypothetical protein
MKGKSHPDTGDPRLCSCVALALGLAGCAYWMCTLDVHAGCARWMSTMVQSTTGGGAVQVRRILPTLKMTTYFSY